MGAWPWPTDASSLTNISIHRTNDCPLQPFTRQSFARMTAASTLALSLAGGQGVEARSGAGAMEHRQSVCEHGGRPWTRGRPQRRAHPAPSLPRPAATCAPGLLLAGAPPVFRPRPHPRRHCYGAVYAAWYIHVCWARAGRRARLGGRRLLRAL
ncbi:hypothetical protein B484DRAFT_288256 [Ochromonadaceae sp. CCMP2298]|nr:hypothetical protein B484DRAFT_288256 [Ochromonadaceae sp. CCMP2298]